MSGAYLMKYLFLIVFLICPLCAFSGTIDPNNSDDQYIEYGKDFPFVGQLVSKSSHDELLGSAVAIDDHNILTASHNILSNRTYLFVLGEKTFCITKITKHKNSTITDIAICYIQESLDLKKYPELYSNNNEINKFCSICGYGRSGNFLIGTNYTERTLLRKAGTNFIDKIEDNKLVCSPSRANDPLLTKLEFLIAPGDSGGGLFIDGKLAGINSERITIVGNPGGSYESYSRHTRISSLIDWINTNRFE